MQNDYERNKKYFKQHIPTWPTVVGFAAVAAGLFMLLILGSLIHGGWMWTGPGLGLTLAGAVLLVVLGAIKIKDSEIGQVIPEEKERFGKDFAAAFVETNAAKLRFQQTYGNADRKKEDPFEPVLFGTYLFEGEGVLSKKGSDGKSRSSLYSMSAFALRHEVLCLGERKISLISPDQPEPDRFEKYAYVDLDKAELVKSDKVGYEGHTKYRHLRITDNAGAVIMEFPILADAAADEYVAEINQKIMRAKETQANA